MQSTPSDAKAKSIEEEEVEEEQGDVFADIFAGKGSYVMAAPPAMSAPGFKKGAEAGKETKMTSVPLKQGTPGEILAILSDKAILPSDESRALIRKYVVSVPSTNFYELSATHGGSPRTRAGAFQPLAGIPYAEFGDIKITDMNAGYDLVIKAAERDGFPRPFDLIGESAGVLTYAIVQNGDKGTPTYSGIAVDNNIASIYKALRLGLLDIPSERAREIYAENVKVCLELEFMPRWANRYYSGKFDIDSFNINDIYECISYPFVIALAASKTDNEPWRSPPSGIIVSPHLPFRNILTRLMLRVKQLLEGYDSRKPKEENASKFEIFKEFVGGDVLKYFEMIIDALPSSRKNADTGKSILEIEPKTKKEEENVTLFLKQYNMYDMIFVSICGNAANFETEVVYREKKTPSK